MAGSNGVNASESKKVVPLNTWVLISNFKLAYNLLRRPDGSFDRHLAEFLDRKVPANDTPVDGVNSVDILIHRPTNLLCRVYRPCTTTAASAAAIVTVDPEKDPTSSSVDSFPVIIFFHGGSFAHSSSNSAIYDSLCRRFTSICNAVVVSVNYRRSPEHRYPCAYEDGWEAVKWVASRSWLRSGKEDSIVRIFLAGDSSGGNIAHHVAVRSIGSGIKIFGNILLNSMFGGEDRKESELRFDGKYFVTLQDRDWYWKAFLPEGADRNHPACNPFGPNGVSLSGLPFPKSLITVAGLDLTCDWQLEYALGLKKAKQDIKLLYLKQATIGFYLLPSRTTGRAEGKGNYLVADGRGPDYQLFAALGILTWFILVHYRILVPSLSAMMSLTTGSGSRKLKVAIIHPDLGLGGAERLILDAAVELSEKGHNVHVFTASHDRNRCFEETISGPFHVKVYGSFIPRHIFYCFHAICAYLRCIFVALCVLFFWDSFDVVVTDQVSAIIPLLKIKRSMKIVFYCHFPDLLLAKHTTLLRKIYRKPIDMIEEATTGMADLILVNSKFTASTFANTFKHLHSRGIQPAVLYPAVNLEQFDEAYEYKLNFLSINRFERKKNIQLAIASFAIFQSLEESSSSGLHLNTSLTVAGGFDSRLKENVEYLDELKTLAEKEGVSDRVNFITSCTTMERNAMLSKCICVIYTPEDEHFGIVPLEAMAAQKPVIACNSGGPIETIKHDITGFLCDPSPKAFALAMSKLVNNPGLPERMGKDARIHVMDKFSTRIFGQQLNRYVLDVYHRRIE